MAQATDDQTVDEAFRLIEVGRAFEAVALLDEALRKDPRNRGFNYLRSQAFVEYLATPDAVKAASAYAHAFPDDPQGALLQHRALSLAMRHEEALAAASRAETLAGVSDATQAARASRLLALGERDKELQILAGESGRLSLSLRFAHFPPSSAVEMEAAAQQRATSGLGEPFRIRKPVRETGKWLAFLAAQQTSYRAQTRSCEAK